MWRLVTILERYIKSVNNDIKMRFLSSIKPKPKVINKHHYLFTADALKVLKQIPDESIKVVLTDPPYNIGLKYNSYKDRKNWDEYYGYLGKILHEISRILREDGSLYLHN